MLEDGKGLEEGIFFLCRGDIYILISLFLLFIVIEIIVRGFLFILFFYFIMVFFLFV